MAFIFGSVVSLFEGCKGSNICEQPPKHAYFYTKIEALSSGVIYRTAIASLRNFISHTAGLTLDEIDTHDYFQSPYSKFESTGDSTSET